MAMGLGGLARSTLSSVQDWMDATLNAPLFVATTESSAAPSFHFPASMYPQLQAMDGIEEVQAVRNLKVQVKGNTALLLSTDIGRFAARTRGRRVVAGNYDEMHRVAAEGKGVVVSENFAELQHLSKGDTVRLMSPRGELALPVTGILKDYSTQEGTIFMERSLYMRYWNDDTVDLFRLYLKKSASADQVKRAILGRFERERRLFVLSSVQVRQYVLGVVNQWFAMTYIQIAIAVLVSILGILNTLTVSISERQRELGVLRAIGGLTTQVRRTIWLEAVAVAAIGLVLGFALGAANLYYTLQMVRRDFTGMSLDYEFPFRIALSLIPIILTAALIAAFSPAEYAVRINLVEALEYE
jgi:putative ABC transport system permease protein